MVGTPGPANLIVMLAGVRQGLRQSFSFILGLIVGKVALNLFIGFGFGLVLAEACLLPKYAFVELGLFYFVVPSKSEGRMLVAPDLFHMGRPMASTFLNLVIH